MFEDSADYENGSIGKFFGFVSGTAHVEPNELHLD
jgi:hypothetical protein